MELLFDHFLAPEARPFAIAAMMIIIIGSIELFSMVIGFSLSEVLGKSLGFDGDSNSGLVNAVSWLNVGGVPLLVFILIVLAYFSMAGFLIQSVARDIAAPLPTWMAAAAATALALPLVRGTSRLVAKIIPKDESYAISLRDLVGRVGEVMVGPLDSGLPGRVRVTDMHGNPHFVAAVAAPQSPPLPQGTSVLLVDLDKTHFIAIAATDDLKPSRSSLVE